MLKHLFRLLPDAVGYRLVVLKRLSGWRPRECPLCGHVGRFSAVGQPLRYDARCNGCGSRERHRLFALALAAHPLPEGMEVLHFAPESALRTLLSKGSRRYRTADLNPTRADISLNIEAIALEENSTDIIVANQVLEHVDDEKALPELYRVLRPSGVLIVTVPMIEGWSHTYENLAITTPKERSLHFGQDDHVRYYGRDFRDRLKAPGFTIDEFVASPEHCVRYGLIRGERIFFCRK